MTGKLARETNTANDRLVKVDKWIGPDGTSGRPTRSRATKPSQDGKNIDSVKCNKSGKSITNALCHLRASQWEMKNITKIKYMRKVYNREFVPVKLIAQQPRSQKDCKVMRYWPHVRKFQIIWISYQDSTSTSSAQQAWIRQKMKTSRIARRPF